jgi:hypothetical protein
LVDYGRKIAARSLNFSKSYIGVSVLLAGYGVGLSNIPHFLVSSNVLPNSPGLDVEVVLPYIAVAMIALSGITIPTAVDLLFVYDKNNGMLEYLLSTGMDQLDIFTGYLKAALLMSVVALASVNAANIFVGLLTGNSITVLATVSLLSFVIGLAGVSFVTVSMAAFGSLQKTPMGANQPLGLALGVIPVFPAFVLPIIFQSQPVLADAVLAVVVIVLALGVLLASSRLIKREKLLP